MLFQRRAEDVQECAKNVRIAKYSKARKDVWQMCINAKHYLELRAQKCSYRRQGGRLVQPGVALLREVVFPVSRTGKCCSLNRLQHTKVCLGVFSGVFAAGVQARS